MFEAVRSNKRIVQGILGLITLSFAFFGIESYLRNSNKNEDIAIVGGTPISAVEYDRAQREGQERVRSNNNGQVDEALFRSKAFRQAVLNGLINQRATALQANRAHLSVNDRQLQAAIGSIPSFQSGGQFDSKLYQSVLESQGMNRQGFESRLRQELAVQQLVSPVGEGALAPVQSAKWLLQTQLEKREIRTREFLSAKYLSKVDINADAIKNYYEKNQQLFDQPAKIRAEYIVLDSQQIENSITIPDEVAKKWYEAHKEKYSTPEERRASHILVSVPAGATEDAVGKAKAEAEGLLVKLRSDPSSFGALASKYSQDPGSAQKMGDLGYFGRGVMVKPFEDAIFQLKNIGDLTGLIRSDFGFHIIELTGLKPQKVRSFEDVAAEIRTELVKEAVSKRFAETAESFTNAVYEQADSLAPVAERFKLRIQQSDWIPSNSDAVGDYKSKKLVGALFSDDALIHHRNTEAIDVGGGTLVSARVIAHEPAHRLTIEEAKGQITQLLKKEQASKLAEEDGVKALGELKGGQLRAADGWTAPQTVQRGAGLAVDLVKATFSMPASAKLPSYSGYSTQSGDYILVMLEGISTEAVKQDDPRLKSVQAQYQQLLGRSELNGYVSEIKSRLGVEVYPAALRDIGE